MEYMDGVAIPIGPHKTDPNSLTTHSPMERTVDNDGLRILGSGRIGMDATSMVKTLQHNNFDTKLVTSAGAEKALGNQVTLNFDSDEVKWCVQSVSLLCPGTNAMP